MHQIATILVLVFVMPGPVHAQQSLKDVARRNGGKAAIVVSVDVPHMPLRDMVATSSLVLLGRIAEITPRLSDDETCVYTEYTVQPLHILKQPANLASAPKPGKTSPIRFLLVGGVIKTDGLVLSAVSDVADREAPIRTGSVYWLLLSPPTPSPMTTTRMQPALYEPTNGHYSIFPVSDGTVRNFNRKAAKLHPVPTADSERFANILKSYVISTKQ